MATIVLNRGMVAIVDDADFEWLSQWKWRSKWGRASGKYYAVRVTTRGGKNIEVLMHREVAGLAFGDGKLIDHRNGNGLDNRRENLRIATTAQNAQNRGKSPRNTSGYKGVTFHAQTGKWQAGIKQGGRSFYLGLFSDPAEAHAAYAREAGRRFGQFANTGGAA